MTNFKLLLISADFACYWVNCCGKLGSMPRIYDILCFINEYYTEYGMMQIDSKLQLCEHIKTEYLKMNL